LKALDLIDDRLPPHTVVEDVVIVGYETLGDKTHNAFITHITSQYAVTHLSPEEYALIIRHTYVPQVMNGFVPQVDHLFGGLHLVGGLQCPEHEGAAH
jgi:hypothetical protein